MNWFSKCSTTADVKKLYRELAMKYHPDRPGGNTEVMQKINSAYLEALKGMDGQAEASRNQDGETYTYTYTYKEDVEQAVIDMITKTVRSGVLDKGVELWLIGSWLWATGDTKPNRQILGDLGYKFNGRKQAWYWHLGKWRRRASNTSLDDIARKYGAEKVAAGGRKQDEDERKQLT